MVLLGLLPVAFFALTVANLHRRGGDFRWALIQAALGLGATTVVLTECLSVVGWFRPGPLRTSWFLLVLAALAVTWSRRRGLVVPAFRTMLADVRRAPVPGIGALVVLTGVVALASPPNTWDSMTYHLPRALHWLQNGDVWPYPTAISRQIYLSPFSEYTIAHLVALSGSTRFVNVPQWLAYLGCTVTVSLIAEQLGGRRRGQIVAALLAASLPIAVMEATSTQNDLIAAYWMTALTAIIIEMHRRDPADLGGRWRLLPLAGLAGGLAILSKGTAWALMLPFVAWGVAIGIRRWQSGSVAPAAVGVLIAGAIVAPFLVRNVAVFGSPFGPSHSHRYANEQFGPDVLASNVLRNVALQFALPNETVNGVLLERPIRALHGILGSDPDDPRTGWTSFRVSANVNDEDHAPNPLHTILALGGLAVVAGWSMRRRTSPGPMGPYALAIAVSFLTFSAVLKWQPWQTRLLLPWYVLSAPFVGVVVQRFGRRVVVGITTLAIVGAVPFALFNRTRPVIAVGGMVTDAPNVITGDRTSIVFAKRPELRDPYTAVAHTVAELGCQVVGLDLEEDDWEFPLWWLLDAVSGLEPVFEHVDPDPATIGTRPAREPCAVVAVGHSEIQRRYVGTGYRRLRSLGGMTVYTPTAPYGP